MIRIRMLASFLLLWCVSAPQGGAAQETEIVITPTREESPLREVASSVSVLTGKQLEAFGERTVAEALTRIPGVDVVRSGGLGGNAAVFLRGANSEHTLLLIDGIEANNPISPNRAFNFADLPIDNIERIEILRGPQSTLYGSDALGGVINIVTKRGAEGMQWSASAEGGSYRTAIERLTLSGGARGVTYSTSLYREDSESISAARASFGNSEHDDHSVTSWSANLGVDRGEDATAELVMRYVDGRTGIDNGGGIGGDDPNREVKNRSFFGRAGVRMRWSDVVSQRLFVARSDHYLSDNNDRDPANPLLFQRSSFDGALTKVGLENAVRASRYLSLLAGAESEEESGSSSFYSESAYGPYADDLSERSATTNGYFAQARWAFDDSLFATTGVRLDDHSRFGSRTTWRIAPVWNIDATGTRVSATAGTGFKAPSLFQLYSSYGNDDLRPERSLGYDVGIEQRLSSKLSLRATWFRNSFDNLITFDPSTYILENIAQARTSGVETALIVRFSPTVVTTFSGTYTDTEDRDTGESLLRRSRLKGGATVEYQDPSGGSATVNAFYVGSRFDNDFSTYPPTRERLAGYLLLNAAVSLPVARDISVFVRGENLLDREYEEVLGFGTSGAAVYAGVKLVMR